MLKIIHNTILYLLAISVSFSYVKIGGRDVYPFFYTTIFYIAFFVLNWKFYFSYIKIEDFTSSKCLFFLLLLYPVAIIVDFFSGYELINNNIPVREIFFIVLTFLISLHLIYERVLVKRYIFSLIFGATLSAVLVMFGFGLYRDDVGERLSLFGQNPNQSGMEFAFISGCSLFFFLAFKSRRSYAFLFPLLISIITLFKTGSRGSLIGCFFIFLGILFFKRDNIKKILQLFFISSVAIVVLFPVFKENMLSFKRLAAVVDGEDSTLAGRTDIWSVYLDEFDFATILCGKGYAGFDEYRIKRGMYKDTGNGKRLKNSHSEFLKILSTSGILGIIIYLLFLFTIFNVAYVHYMYKRSVFPFICCIPIMIFSFANQVVGGILVHAIYLPLIIYFTSDLLYLKKFCASVNLK